MISRALLRRYPTGTPATWTDASGTYEGIQLLDGLRIAETCFSHIPTLEEIAAAAAAAASAAKVTELKDDVVAVLAELKAGTLTFGTAARDNAAKKLARGLRFVLKGEIDQ